MAQHADIGGHDEGHRLTHGQKKLQECTAHSKVLHKSPQRGEGEYKDIKKNVNF